ncbi:hypothetical protein EAH68_12675 [Corynebacterium hylobatis]|uniref:Uncharacterized protein n=1 Tax=Corynebacterium hylobatis TaxID=1859290 RepID=A0A3S0BG19_9CORY|nr:hypothetical protein [Corynebacterium hylobatis]RSZ61514.1 hypothetical protein EAH68_12675 [Corynebacterium hylobatis]
MQQEASTQITSLNASRNDLLGWLTREWTVEDDGDIFTVWAREHRTTESWDVFRTATQRDLSTTNPRHKRIVAAIKEHITHRVLLKDMDFYRDCDGRHRVDRNYIVNHDDQKWQVVRSLMDGETEYEVYSLPDVDEIPLDSEAGRAVVALVEEFTEFRKDEL